MALRVVAHLDIIEDVMEGLLPVVVRFPLDMLSSQQLEATLRYRTDVAIAAPPHTRHQAMSLQKLLPVLAAELTSLV